MTVEECGESYELVADSCVRVSPYPLGWAAAEAKCQEEGGHLLSITSQQLQTELDALIRQKMKLKEFFEFDKFDTGLSSSTEKFWVGGTVGNSSHSVQYCNTAVLNLYR